MRRLNQCTYSNLGKNGHYIHRFGSCVVTESLRNSHKTKCWICDFIWLEWSIQKMCRAYYRTMRGEPKSVNEEEEANTMSVILPMDQGIIRSLKHKYHRCFNCNFLQSITFTKECYKVSLMPYKHLQCHGMLSVWKQLWTVIRRLNCVKCQNLTLKMMVTQTKSVHLEDVHEKMNVTCPFAEYAETDDSPSCAVCSLGNFLMC